MHHHNTELDNEYVIRCEKCGYYTKYVDNKTYKCKNELCDNLVKFSTDKLKFVNNCIKDKIIKMGLWIE